MAVPVGSSREPRVYARLLVLLCVGLVGVTLLVQSASPLFAAAAPTGRDLRALAGPFLIGYASADNFWTLPDASTYGQRPLVSSTSSPLKTSSNGPRFIRSGRCTTSALAISTSSLHAPTGWRCMATRSSGTSRIRAG